MVEDTVRILRVVVLLTVFLVPRVSRSHHGGACGAASGAEDVQLPPQTQQEPGQRVPLLRQLPLLPVLRERSVCVWGGGVTAPPGGLEGTHLNPSAEIHAPDAGDV